MLSNKETHCSDKSYSHAKWPILHRHPCPSTPHTCLLISTSDTKGKKTSKSRPQIFTIVERDRFEHILYFDRFDIDGIDETLNQKLLVTFSNARLPLISYRLAKLNRLEMYKKLLLSYTKLLTPTWTDQNTHNVS